MTDFNKILTPGDVDGGIVNVVVEIPAGSNNKVEWDREKALFKLDRVEPSIFSKPINYGFIPQTIDEDGDELDVLILTDAPLPMGVYMEAKVLGVMKFHDDGDIDDKVLVVPADDRHSGDRIQSMSDIPPILIDQISHHFNHYKDLKKPNTTEVKNWDGVDEAKKVIRESIERWNKQYK